MSLYSGTGFCPMCLFDPVTSWSVTSPFQSLFLCPVFKSLVAQMVKHLLMQETRV